MAERFKAAVLKTVVDESLPRVRISIPPLCVHLRANHGDRLAGRQGWLVNTYKYMESWLSGRKQQFTKLPSPQGDQGFESSTLRQTMFDSSDLIFVWLRPYKQCSTICFNMERCQSGRSCSFAKAVYRKVPRVRIPPSPLVSREKRHSYRMNVFFIPIVI